MATHRLFPPGMPPSAHSAMGDQLVTQARPTSPARPPAGDVLPPTMRRGPSMPTTGGGQRAVSAREGTASYRPGTRGPAPSVPNGVTSDVLPPTVRRPTSIPAQTAGERGRPAGAATGPGASGPPSSVGELLRGLFPGGPPPGLLAMLMGQQGAPAQPQAPAPQAMGGISPPSALPPGPMPGAPGIPPSPPAPPMGMMSPPGMPPPGMMMQGGMPPTGAAPMPGAPPFPPGMMGR